MGLKYFMYLWIFVYFQKNLYLYDETKYIRLYPFKPANS